MYIDIGRNAAIGHHYVNKIKNMIKSAQSAGKDRNNGHHARINCVQRRFVVTSHSDSWLVVAVVTWRTKVHPEP
jgi:hypothetical protein